MTFQGRLPGRPGLWDVSFDDGAIKRLSCREPSFTDDHARWITPGLFDLQVNGIAGVNFTDPDATSEALGRADELIRSGGVSRYCPTVITCSHDTAISALTNLRRAGDEGVMPGAWGFHLEGPWISETDGARGVHRREYVRDVSLAEWDELQAAAGGKIRILTLAPERAGALELVKRAADSGVVVSLGHTEASPEQVAAAVAAGARMSTHLFNGCAPLLHRHANVVYAQLADDSLWACFIADGHHVPLGTLRVGMRTKGISRSILVSDLAHLAGLPDGDYVMEGNAVELRGGGLRVKGSGLLSGAARTLRDDVELLGGEAEPGIESALLMAIHSPADVVGEAAWAGLQPGRRGPLVVFSWDGTRLVPEVIS